MDRRARSVAARWGFEQASQGWQPAIPKELLVRQSRVALALTEQEQQYFQTAKESVYSLLPSFTQLLRKRLGGKYGMSASQRAGDVFLYFTEPSHPIDSWTIHIQVRRNMVMLDIGCIPMVPGTERLDLKNSREVQVRVSDPDLAGLDLMRAARKLLDRMNGR